MEELEHIFKNINTNCCKKCDSSNKNNGCEYYWQKNY